MSDHSSLYQYNTATGIIVPDVATLRSDTRQAARDAFGEQLSVAEQTPQGRVIEAVSLLKADILSMNASVANQLNISYATGRFLDNIGSFFGVERNPSSRTRVLVRVTGDERTVVTAGSLISSKKGYKYEIAADITIQSSMVAEGVAIAVDEGEITPHLDDSDSDEYDPITIISSGIIGWKTVEGIQILSIGAEEESDDAYRSRILSSRVWGVSFVESISSELNKISNLRSSFVYDNGTGLPVLYTTSGKVLNLYEATGMKGVVIPAHHVIVIVDCDQDAYEDVANAIFKTKSVGSGLVRLYEQNETSDRRFGEWDIKDPDGSWHYTKSVTVTESWYGNQYIMNFMIPIEVSFTVVIDIIKNKYVGDVDSLVSDVKVWVHQWTFGNINGVDGLGVNQSVYSHECAAAISYAIPDVKIMDCGLYECDSSELEINGDEIVPKDPNVTRKSKIPIDCIHKGVLTDDNILVRVFDAQGNQI